MPRILVIGSGAVGSAVIKLLETYEDNEIIVASRNSEVKVDIESEESIRTLFETVGDIDHVVAATGRVHFGPLATMTAAEMMIGFQSKFLGQALLVMIGQEFLNDGGSFTLTSGFLETFPGKNFASVAGVNAAIGGFVRSAALELPRGLRLNVVSPGLLTESAGAYGPFFAGCNPVDGSAVARAFIRSIYGGINGKTLTIVGAPEFIET